jgi:hypothetical protein
LHMTSQDIALWRLFSQRITGGGITDPAALVKWMGCIRAEDFAAAKWAVGHRVQGSTDAGIERVFNEGLILRTHVLQPIRHFVSPDDIRWLLALTAPRLKAANRSLQRCLGIGEEMLRKSRRIMIRALGKGQMTRVQLSVMLKESDVEVDDIRMGLLLMDAELNGLICSGSKDGLEFTYTLLEERAPVTGRYDRTEAIAELARRYFRSRGPATIYDFLMWSGLRPADAGRAMEMNKQWLGSEVVGGQTYWFDPSGWDDQEMKRLNRDPSLFLLPVFDELTTAYSSNGIFKPAVIIDGQVSGSWTYMQGKGMVKIKVVSPVEWSGSLDEAMRKETERYSAFLGKRLILPPA